MTEYDLVRELAWHFSMEIHACCQLQVVPGSSGIPWEKAVIGKFAKGL